VQSIYRKEKTLLEGFTLDEAVWIDTEEETKLIKQLYLQAKSTINYPKLS